MPFRRIRSEGNANSYRFQKMSIYIDKVILKLGHIQTMEGIFMTLLVDSGNLDCTRHTEKERWPVLCSVAK